MDAPPNQWNKWILLHVNSISHAHRAAVYHAGGHLSRRGRAIDLCLLYTSDAADDLLCVELGGPRIIKKKNHVNTQIHSDNTDGSY